MLRLALLGEERQVKMVDGRPKSKCGQSEANSTCVSALIISSVHCQRLPVADFHRLRRVPARLAHVIRSAAA